MTGTVTGARVLLVDNHDSYTGNLLQLLWGATGEEPVLTTNDAVDLDAVAAGRFTHVVLGPGPGTPHRSEDVGRGPGLLDVAQVPVLGVCLGLQTMAVALGGRVVRAPAPAHGRIDDVTRTASVLLDGLPETFPVVRYHSLALAEPVPPGLRVTARSSDGVVMAAEHPVRGWYGVQFHPESIGTPVGVRIVERFLRIPAPADRAAASGTEPVHAVR